ncbi:MAG: phosphatase PAP2 family protein [Thermodesulfobacteriota bacterium]
MRHKYGIWTGLVIVAVLTALAAKYYPYFPGDVALARGVQALLPGDRQWAAVVSRTGEFPWILLIMALVFTLSWTLAGWRAGLLSIVSLAGMLALGGWLGPAVARPRPSPELVQVWRPLSGFSFPSQSALRFAATWGFLGILAAVKSTGGRRAALVLVCAGLLILGAAARIALAAHWPSDVLLSYYLGLLWAGVLIRLALR